MISHDKLDSLVGKTIKAIDDTACNVMIILFTDNTSLTLETEHLGSALYGIDKTISEPH